MLRTGLTAKSLRTADYTEQLMNPAAMDANGHNIYSNAPRSLYQSAAMQPKLDMMPSFLPDVRILPEHPHVEDGAVVSNCSDAIGATWFVTELDSLEIKQECREMLRYNTKIQSFYVDAFF